ncbi:MAG: hypothetical protein AAF969_13090, partial [Bacteroidota bacterium]
MKRNLFKALLLVGILASCSDDDGELIGDIPSDPEPEPTVEANVRINEVQYLGNWVEIVNSGEETVDLSDYFLCLGPGTYRRI